MEHRHNHRQPVNTGVLLYHRGIPVIKSITRDLSLGGVFVEHGADNFKRHDVVEIEFCADVQTDTCKRVPAMVVRSQGDGLGLELHYDCTETRDLLKGLIRADFRDGHGVRIGASLPAA